MPVPLSRNNVGISSVVAAVSSPQPLVNGGVRINDAFFLLYHSTFFYFIKFVLFGVRIFTDTLLKC